MCKKGEPRNWFSSYYCKIRRIPLFRDIRIKVISGILTSINSGFLYYLIESKGGIVSKELNIVEGLFEVLIKSLFYSIVCVLPLVILFGIPLSLLIDYVLQRFNQRNVVISFLLHAIAYFIVVIIYWGISFGVDKIIYMAEPEIAYNVFLFVYTPCVFWMITYLITRGAR
jgi:hypothetical protein